MSNSVVETERNSASETPLWEKTKENSAPLERGRNVSKIEESLATDDKTKFRQVRHFEELVKRTEESEGKGLEVSEDEDVLVHWLSYIKYYQDTFASDTKNQFLLLERCFRAMCVVKRYANDPRFIRVCCIYAERTSRARDIFNHMYQQKIGVGVALFWAAWAFVAEKEKDFAFAEKIFEKAIRKEAQPIKYLLQRQKQFQRRMSRHWLNSTRNEEELVDEVEAMEQQSQRDILGGLSAEAIRRNDRSRSSGGSMPTFTIRSDIPTRGGSKNNGNGTSTAAGFSIYSEENNENLEFPPDRAFVSQSTRVLEREQDRRKENTLAPERWNERGSLMSSSRTGSRSRTPAMPTAAPTAFAVYVDEDCAAKIKKDEEARSQQQERHRRGRDDRTFRERKAGERESAAELLENDPLRYVRDPSRIASDRTAIEDISRKPSKSKSNFSKGTKSSVGFCQNLLKNSLGGEQSFEEARAAAGCFALASASSNFNHMAIEEEQQSSMSIDGSMDLVSMGEYSQQSSAVSSIARQLPSNVRVTPRNASTTSSTVDGQGTINSLAEVRAEPTINTQLALKELSIMFSSPAYGPGDSQCLDRSGGLGPILNESGASESAVYEDGHLPAHLDPNSSFAAVDVHQSPPKRAFGKPLKHKEAEARRDTGFSIHCDTAGETSQNSSASTSELPLQLFTEQNKENAIARTASFTVFQDPSPASKSDSETLSSPRQEQEDTAALPCVDELLSPASGDNSNDETLASLSEVNELLADM